MSIKIKGIKPMFNGIVCTANKVEKSGVLYTGDEGSIDLIQRVISVGDRVNSVKVGDLIKISPRRYQKTDQKYQNLDTETNVEKYKATLETLWPKVTINGRELLFIFDNDVEYIITDYDEEETIKGAEPQLIIPKTQFVH